MPRKRPYCLGAQGCLFCLSAPEVKRMLPVTYQQDCSGTESRLPCSQGGRNSPGTSHSWRRRCYPGSWYSGHRGRWNGIVQGRSSTPVIGHCSHRLSAETQGLSRIHVPLRIAFSKTQNQNIISHVPGTDRWWWDTNDHWIHCSLKKKNQYVDKGFTEPGYRLTKKHSSFSKIAPSSNIRDFST